MRNIPAEQMRKNTAAEIVELLANTDLARYVSIQEGVAYFRQDTDDMLAKDQWPEYCDIQDQLGKFKLELVEVCIEHDCISGDIQTIMPPGGFIETDLENKHDPR